MSLDGCIIVAFRMVDQAVMGVMRGRPIVTRRVRVARVHGFLLHLYTYRVNNPTTRTTQGYPYWPDLRGSFKYGPYSNPFVADRDAGTATLEKP